MTKTMLRHALLALTLVSACRGDAAEKPRPQPVVSAADAQPAPVAQAPELVEIELFGTRQVTREQLLVAMGQPLRELAASVMAGNGSWMEMGLVDELHKLGDFAYVRPSLVGYFEPEGMRYYLTVDFVDRADAARRMPFLPVPEGTYEDPEGLLADWHAYEAKNFELLRDKRISPARTECPAFHCLGDPKHPELAAMADKFVMRVPAHLDELEAILRDDADPLQRAAAAYLLAYGMDGQALVSSMVAAFRDHHDMVRNAAIRVLIDIALYHPEFDVPLAPVLDALEYPATLDRNKAAGVLDGLLRRPGAARLHASIARRSAAGLLAMLRLEQPNNHNIAYDILKTISGESFGERDYAAWERWSKKS